jgi:hypothetical protein
MKKEGYWNILRILGIIILILFILTLILIIIRGITQKQLDDVSPEIPCEQELMEKADVLYVIPKFNNKSIAENMEWCKQILSLNKTLAMHGVYHTYKEFVTDRDADYLQEGIDEFEKCFGKRPDRFKPPQLEISRESENILKSRMQLDFYFNEIFHKVYHCSDTGKVSNNFIDWI